MFAIAILVGFAVWGTERVVPERPAPLVTPPQIVALPPSTVVHSAADGYVIHVSITVPKCGELVKGLVTVVMPEEWERLERRGPFARPTRPMFAVAFDDPAVIPGQVTSRSDSSPSTPMDSWSFAFRNPRLESATGKVAVGRVDSWQTGTRSISLRFSAPWTKSKGLGSCWLSIPELVGPNAQNLAVHGAQAVSLQLPRNNGATPLMSGEFKTSSTIRYQYENAPDRVVKDEVKYEHEYVDILTPPSVGLAALDSPLRISQSESVGLAPSLGVPRWTCRRGSKPEPDSNSVLGIGTDGGFRSSEDGGIGAYLPPNGVGTSCGGWIALATENAGTAYVVWLILIGAAISAALAIVLGWYFRHDRPS